MGIDRCKQWKSWGSGGEEELGGVSLRPASRSEESEKFHMGGGGGGVGGVGRHTGTELPGVRCSRALLGLRAKAQLCPHLKFSVKSTSSVHQLLCGSGHLGWKARERPTHVSS